MRGSFHPFNLLRYKAGQLYFGRESFLGPSSTQLTSPLT